MKVVFLVRSLNIGGAEVQLVTFAKGLRQQGHTVIVAVFYSEGPLVRELQEAGVDVRVLDKRGRWDVFSFAKKVVQLLRQERPHIVHSYLVEPSLLVVMLKPLFPKIKMVWRIRASNVELSRYGWFPCLTFKMSCRLARFADLIIVNSKAGRDYHLAHGYPEDKMVVIPNGIDTEQFYPNPGERRRVRAEWGIAERERLIGLVARLDPMKDHHTILNAAAILAQEREYVPFVCVGDGPMEYRQELHAFARRLGLMGRLLWAGGSRRSLWCSCFSLPSSCSWKERRRCRLFTRSFSSIISSTFLT